MKRMKQSLVESLFFYRRERPGTQIGDEDRPVEVQEMGVVMNGNEPINCTDVCICDPDPTVRHETAKALAASGKKSDIDELIWLLKDDDLSVRWMAINALVTLERGAITPLFTELTHDFESLNLHRSARHVLQQLKERALLLSDELAILDAMNTGASPIDTARAINERLIARIKAGERMNTHGVDADPCQ